MTTPTQLSLRHLRDEGWTVDVCERWLAGLNQRKDLFGIIDLVALRGPETMGVQTTSNNNFNARLNKMRDDKHRPALGFLLEAGWHIVVHGWAKSRPENPALVPARQDAVRVSMDAAPLRIADEGELAVIVTTELIEVVCWCGIPHAIPEALDAQAKRSGRAVFCPMGHEWVHGDPEVKRLKREIEALANAKERLIRQRDDEAKAHSVTKGQLTKARKRAAVTMCPCCHRTFAPTSMARHIKSKHPDFQTMKGAQRMVNANSIPMSDLGTTDNARSLAMRQRSSSNVRRTGDDSMPHLRQMESRALHETQARRATRGRDEMQTLFPSEQPLKEAAGVHAVEGA